MWPVQMAFKDADAAEPIALARLACQTSGEQSAHVELLCQTDDLLAPAQEARGRSRTGRWRASRPLCAMVLAGTPGAGVPAD